MHWIDGDDVEHGMPIVAMALVELIYGDSRVEPMIKFENDYVQPISTIPNQNAAHTWWIVKKTLVKMDENMVKSALSAKEANLVLDKVPTFLEICEYEDPKTLVSHKATSYLGDDMEAIALRRPRFDDKARDAKYF